MHTAIKYYLLEKLGVDPHNEMIRDAILIKLAQEFEAAEKLLPGITEWTKDLFGEWSDAAGKSAKSFKSALNKHGFEELEGRELAQARGEARKAALEHFQELGDEDAERKAEEYADQLRFFRHKESGAIIHGFNGEGGKIINPFKLPTGHPFSGYGELHSSVSNALNSSDLAKSITPAADLAKEQTLGTAKGSSTPNWVLPAAAGVGAGMLVANK